MSVLFITGGTGFIGKEVVKQLAEGRERLLLLVRSAEKASAMLQRMGLGEDTRITLLQGDLSEPGLGLRSDDRELACTADVIIHAGGTMSITLDPAAAKQTFLEGARHVAELAADIQRTKGLRHFIHIVGYMSPFHDGNVDMETDVFQWDGFMKKEGPYERMKFLSDLYIRQQAKVHEYPLSVVNPCTLVGAKPAGTTEQTGGLGILVEALRRKMMPVIPGGTSHWLPIVANDDLARIIAYLARDAAPGGCTYNILGEKGREPRIRELLTLIARELRVPAPRLSVPVSLLRTVMKAGGSRLTGIPAESLSFITDRSFRTVETNELLERMGEAPLNTSDILPMAIADLDYRLTYPNRKEPEGYVKERKGDLAVLVKEGCGIPWVLVHGMLSGADDLVPLAGQLHERTGNPVWIVDLPGFGRSPSLRQGDALQGNVEALCRAIADHPGPIRLAGHSFGAVLAAKAAAALQDKVQQLYLLQPVLHSPRNRMRRWHSTSIEWSRFLLQRLNTASLTRMLLREEGAMERSELPDGYVEAVIQGLSSPRIAAANAAMLHMVHHHLPALSPTALPSVPTTILWGAKDKVYKMTKLFRHDPRVNVIPYGHQFPVFQSQETAQLLIELGSSTE
ncbi:alpha/beta fold hydrolase [Paenibacillus profundus]|uniref:Alpha/beta fold hydrolase n=1 Tax=Paenibacillus profundus TaxID=1173085 RepID=A0ABS8YNL1_9BACL|nr:alpha/beta fold hydrolase [Paenibacillus profundus]MCE5173396.1 alpha/beta fold hydrolase [Paenibacillus profundus]